MARQQGRAPLTRRLTLLCTKVAAAWPVAQGDTVIKCSSLLNVLKYTYDHSYSYY
jgi:hypothetical protein